MQRTKKGLDLRRLPESGIPVIRVHYSADPTMTPERVAVLPARYASDARWRREMESDYGAMEGERLYSEYKPEINDCEPFDVSDPSRWTIWMACDPHMRTPHAFLWEAFAADGDRVVCGEIWPEQHVTVEEYAQVVHWIESDSCNKPWEWAWARGKPFRIYKRLMDTHGSAANSDMGSDYFAAYRQHKLHFYPAKKGHAELDVARDKIARAMIPERVIGPWGERLEPRRRIFRTCAETRAELENVRFPSGDVERPGQERPMTYRKHMLDCAHYIQSANPGFVLPRREVRSWRPIYKATGY